MTKARMILGAILVIQILYGCSGAPSERQSNEARQSSEPTIGEMENERRFTQWFARTVSDFDNSVSVAVKSPLTLELSRSKEGVKGSIEYSLDRFFNKCKVQPYNARACYRLVMSYLPSILSPGFTGDVDVNSVIAIIRTEDYVASARARSHIIAIHYVGPLWLIYALDTPTSTRMLTLEELKILKLKEENLLGLAKRNLTRILGPIDTRYKSKLPHNAMQTIHQGSIYESSRLLLSEQWDELAKMQDYPLLVSVPARDLIIYSTASNAAARGALIGLDYQAAQKTDFPISPVVLRWTSNGWIEEK